MAKLKKLNLGAVKAPRPVDPMEIWGRIHLRGSIKNIWGPQEQALKEWHLERETQDLVVEMNTGGGKTLVGLIAAQSLLNELRTPVVYVCPNNQLIQQTAARCVEIGFSPATRYSGKWQEKDAFFSAETFCITNYASLFTGFSPIEKINPGAIIFDDAHVADQAIRGQFTVDIDEGDDAYEEIVSLYRRHFTHSGLGDRLEELRQGHHAVPLFVPMFVVFKHAAKLRRILIDNGVDANDRGTKYAWERIKDNLSSCTVIIAANRIEISPTVLPLQQLPYFQPPTRRIYLTATLPSQATFVRTFGVSAPKIVRPGGKSGDAQRLFIFVDGETDEVQRDVATKLVEDEKACVISPTTHAGEQWCPPAELYDDSSDEQIEKFRNAAPPSMLALVARYDGIDLPGDSCRILILDRLPYGESLLDRFVDESLQIETIRQSHTATRIVQAIGRIFRSNTDHGVVLTVGPDLQQWLQLPRNRVYLPALLQKQIQFALALKQQVTEGQTSWQELIQAVLTGDDGWDENYNEYINEFDAVAAPGEADWYLSALMKERDAYENLWAGQPQKAAAAYSALADTVEADDRRLAGWFRHWAGLSLLVADDMTAALDPLIQAANVRAELGRPSEKRDRMFQPPAASGENLQATRMVELYSTKRAKISQWFEKIESDLIYTPGSDKDKEAQKGVKKCQKAMELLGTLLGLDSTQPDGVENTGPDVLWALEAEISAWGFEMKTGKDTEVMYPKKEVGQCHDHKQWLDNNYSSSETRLSLVGHFSKVADDANPSPELTVIELGGLQELAGRVKTLYDEIDAGDKSDLEGRFAGWLEYNGLVWPRCVESLPSRLAIDLKK